MRSISFGMMAAAEAALVLLLLLIAAWQYWVWASAPAVLEDAGAETMASKMPTLGLSALIFAVLFGAVVYGMFQLIGKSSLALWTAAVLVLVPQGPGIWAHNKLGWGRFMGMETPVGYGNPLLVAGGLFLVSLLGLVVLHRVITMRRLGRLLVSRRVESDERDGILRSEGLVLGGIVGLSLVLSVLLVVAGAVLSRAEWLISAVPWTVVTIGGGASLLLIGFTALYLQSLSAQEESESSSEE